MTDIKIYEESVLLKLYHNKRLQDEYLNDLLPGVFITWKLLAFTMIQLHRQEVRITTKNIMIMQKHKKVNSYAISHNLIELDAKEFIKLLIDSFSD